VVRGAYSNGRRVSGREKGRVVIVLK